MPSSSTRSPAVAQSRGIHHVQRHAIDRDALAHDVARGARDRRDDRRVVTGEAVQQARLARVGSSGDDHGHALAQQAPLARAVEHALEVIAHRLEALGELAVGEEVDFLFGKIDGRLHVGAQLDDRLGEAAHHGGELPLQRAHRRARRLARARIDQVRDRLRLRQIELVVEEGALRELARLRAARAELQGALHQCLEHHRAAVALQLEHVLTRIGVRGRERTARGRHPARRPRHQGSA